MGGCGGGGGVCLARAQPTYFNDGGGGGCISYSQAVPCSFLATNLFSGFIMCKIIVIKYISMTCKLEHPFVS